MDICYEKAEPEDKDEIMRLIRAAVEKMNRDGIRQWDELYPDENTIQHDIENGELIKGSYCGKIVVIYVINESCDDEYNDADWQYTGGAYRILHRLCVCPDFQNQGIAGSALRHIESVLSAEGIASLRLDAFLQNPYALSLYKKFGYRIAGYADWRMGRFCLMEKRLF